MRASIAYFAGAGTVLAAIAAGLGGGLLMGNIMNPQPSKQEISKAERRAAPSQVPQPSPSPVAAANTPPSPVPYLAQVQPAANAPVVVTPPPGSPQPSGEAGTSAPSAPTQAATANDSAKPAETSKPQEQASAQEPASSVDNANAKARDADLKRLADKRKAERRQHWAARRPQQREQEPRDVEREIREDGDAREIIVRRDDSDRPMNFGQPMPMEFPRINLFGPD